MTAATTPMKTAGPAEMYPAAGVYKHNSISSLSLDERAKTTHNRDESHDRPRAEPNRTPLLLEAVVHEHPGQATHRAREVRVDDRESGLDVGGERGTAVESEPADPEERSAEEDVAGIRSCRQPRRKRGQGGRRTRCCEACRRDARCRIRDACLWRWVSETLVEGKTSNSPR